MTSVKCTQQVNSPEKVKFTPSTTCDTSQNKSVAMIENREIQKLLGLPSSVCFIECSRRWDGTGRFENSQGLFMEVDRNRLQSTEKFSGNLNENLKPIRKIPVLVCAFEYFRDVRNRYLFTLGALRLFITVNAETTATDADASTKHHIPHVHVSTGLCGMHTDEIQWQNKMFKVNGHLPGFLAAFCGSAAYEQQRPDARVLPTLLSSLTYNIVPNQGFISCRCANGYIGQRCEFKDLDGSYLPSRQRVMLETASIAGGATIAIFLVFIICIAAYIHCRRKQKELRSSNCVDTVDGPGRDPELRPFSNRSRSLVIFMTKNPNSSILCCGMKKLPNALRKQKMNRLVI
ncbi:Protein spitz [Melipona quadrifasciata]|uniref:Protein spitz n=1 Tax=Melipona quadrifasciata TaxID=166423 RepID=A0A0M9A8E5_9HYME|nr:Protein spitz [Melipona quadrifasciata]